MYLYINKLNIQALNFGAKVEFILRLQIVYCYYFHKEMYFQNKLLKGPDNAFCPKKHDCLKLMKQIHDNLGNLTVQNM